MRGKILNGLTAAMIAATLATSAQAAGTTTKDIVTTFGVKKGTSGATGAYLSLTSIKNHADLSIEYNQLNQDTSFAISKGTFDIWQNKYISADVGIAATLQHYNSSHKFGAAGVIGLKLLNDIETTLYLQNSTNYGMMSKVALFSQDTHFGYMRFGVYADLNYINKEIYNRFGGALELSF